MSGPTTFWFDLGLIVGVLAMWFCISSAPRAAVIGVIARFSIGSVSFIVPFFNSAVVGEYPLGWRAMPSWLAGGGLGEPR